MKELKEVQDLEKCDRLKTDGVTDKATTREACASKKVGIDMSFTLQNSELVSLRLNFSKSVRIGIG